MGEAEGARLPGGVSRLDGKPLTQEVLAGAGRGKEHQVSAAPQAMSAVHRRSHVHMQQDIEAHGEKHGHRQEEDRHYRPPFSDTLGDALGEASVPSARNTRTPGAQWRLT